MNKSLRIYLFALIALIGVVFLIDSGRKKPLNWTPSYMLKDKIPLGLYVLDHEIDSFFGDSVIRYSKTPYEYLQDSAFRKETYFIIRDYAYLDEESQNSLLSRVEKGNTLFITSDGFPGYMLDTLHIGSKYTYFGPTHFAAQLFQKDTIEVSLANSAWETRYALSPVFGQMRFTALDTATTKVLGYMYFPDSTKYISFVKVNYGKGTIYFHNQPAAFSNFALLSSSGLSEYAQRVLSYIPNNEPVVWFVQGQEEATKGRTPLSVIFQYPALRMVWLIFLYGLVLFIFFQAKRTQRVVPIVKPLANTTVEFAQTIGNLYYQEGDVSNVVQKKIVFFLDKIRTRYYVDTRKLDEVFVSKLQIKSGKSRKLIENIVHFIQWFERNNSANETDLMRLNEFIEEFWKK